MAQWGQQWGNPWGLTVVPQEVADLRQNAHGEGVYALFVEGVPYVWTTAHPNDALWGSGDGTWIGTYENLAGLPHQRTVVGGLKLPDTLNVQPELDLTLQNLGMFKKTPNTFTIVDLDGILPGLFAQEGQGERRLAQRIGPADTPTTFALFDPNGAATWSDYICVGTETLGPSGQRRWFPCMPDQAYGGFGVTWTGREHAVWNDGSNAAEQPYAGPPEVLVTDEPFIWEGRYWALYRIDRDDRLGHTPQSYPHWGLQHDGGNLVTWGILRDAATLEDAGQTWKIQTYGPESWLDRNLGSNLHREWMPITSSTLQLGDNERYVAVEFSEHIIGTNAANPNGDFDVFESLSFTQSLSASYTDQNTLLQTIQTVIENIRDGSISHDYDDAVSGDFTTDGHEFEFRGDQVRIRNSSSSIASRIFVRVCMHEKVWRWLGWDTVTQPVSSESLGNDRTVRARWLNAGDRFVDSSITTAARPLCPGMRYLSFDFNSISREEAVYQNNDQESKFYRPENDGGTVIVFGDEYNDTFQLPNEAQYIPNDPLFPVNSEDVAPGFPPDESSIFLFRGKRVTINPNPDPNDPDTQYVVTKYYSYQAQPAPRPVVETLPARPRYEFRAMDSVFHHEASHAVTAAAQGRLLETRVSTFKPGPKIPKAETKVYTPTERTRDVVRSDLLIALAGPVADCVYMERHGKKRGALQLVDLLIATSADMGEVWRLMGELRDDPGAMIDSLQQVYTSITACWAGLDAVATALRAHGTLNAQQVGDAFWSAYPERERTW